MHSDKRVKNPVITPKARRPIRSAMVSYGLKNKTNTESVSHNNETCSQDQVDNVMSKMARHMSPVTTRKNQVKRADSYSSDQHYTEEEEEAESENDSDPSEENVSNSFTRSPYIDDSSLGNRLASESQQSINNPNIDRRRSIHAKPDESSSNSYKLFGLGVVLISALSYLYLGSDTELVHRTTQTENGDDVLFENNINDLKHKYNVDDDSILKIKTGISTVFSRMDTGSFVFVYNSNRDHFDSRRFDKFMNEVAYAAAKYLRNSSPVRHTVVLSSSLEMEEHGELISRYHDEFSRSGVLLVKDIGALPSQLAMAFHYYCDEYEPLVKRSAVIFTLNAANCSDSDDNDVSFILSKLSDSELITLLNQQPANKDYDLNDLIKLASESKSQMNKPDLMPIVNFESPKPTLSQIREKHLNMDNNKGNGPVFRLDNQEVNAFSFNKDSDPEHIATQKLYNLLYGRPSEIDKENNSNNDEKKELIFNMLVAQLKLLCCKKTELVNENDINKYKHTNQKEANNIYNPQQIRSMSNEHMFLILNDEIKNNDNDGLISVDPNSLGKNSTVLLLGPIATPLEDAQLKIAMSRIENELSKKEYVPLLQQLSEGKINNENVQLVNSIVTGPETRRYIKPHRCNHQSKLARVYGGPKWLICTGYLNLNRPSLYD